MAKQVDERIIIGVESDNSGYKKGAEERKKIDEKSANDFIKNEKKKAKEQSKSDSKQAQRRKKKRDTKAKEQEKEHQEEQKRVAKNEAYKLKLQLKGIEGYNKMLDKAYSLNRKHNAKIKALNDKKVKDYSKMLREAYNENDKFNAKAVEASKSKMVKENKMLAQAHAMNEKYNDKRTKELRIQADKEEKIAKDLAQYKIDLQINSIRKNKQLMDSAHSEALAENKKFNRKMMDSSKKRGDSFSSRMKGRMANVAMSLGAVSLIGGAIAGVASITRAFISTTMELEEALVQVNTILDVSSGELQEFGDDMLDVSRKVGMSIEEMLAGAYQALSSGAVGAGDTEGLKAFMETAGTLAKAGFTTVEKSVDSLTTVLNSYELGMEDATRVSDILIESQRQGKFTIDQLTKSLSKVVPIASASNVSFESMSGALVQLTLDGNSTAKATTQLSRLMGELNDESSDLGKVLVDETGKSFAQLMEEGKDLGDVMDILSKYMIENDVTAKSMSESLETAKAIMSLAKGDADALQESIDGISEAQGTAEETADQMGETLKTTYTNLKTSLADVFWNDDVKWALQGLMNGVMRTMDFIKGEINGVDITEAENSIARQNDGYVGSKETKAFKKNARIYQTKMSSEEFAGYIKRIEDGMDSENSAKYTFAERGYKERIAEANMTPEERRRVGGNSGMGIVPELSTEEADKKAEKDAREAETLALANHKKSLLGIEMEYEQLKALLRKQGFTDMSEIDKGFEEAILEADKAFYAEKAMYEDEALQNSIDSQVHYGKKKEEELKKAQKVELDKVKQEEKMWRNRISIAKKYATVFNGTSEEVLANIVKVTGGVITNNGLEMASDGAKHYYAGMAKQTNPFTAVQGTAEKKAGKVEFGKGVAMAGAGVALTAVGGAMSEDEDESNSSEDGYSDPEDVAEDAVEEKEECQELVIQGAEPFIDSIEKYYNNKYNVTLKATKKSRRR